MTLNNPCDIAALHSPVGKTIHSLIFFPKAMFQFSIFKTIELISDHADNIPKIPWRLDNVKHSFHQQFRITLYFYIVEASLKKSINNNFESKSFSHIINVIAQIMTKGRNHYTFVISNNPSSSIKTRISFCTSIGVKFHITRSRPYPSYSNRGDMGAYPPL